MTAIIVNGRFLTRRVTGVQRHARSMVLALLELGADVSVIVPRSCVPPAELAAHTRRTGTRLDGHTWEQTVLARAVRQSSGVLWGPGNSGPLAVRRQVITLHDLHALSHPEWVGRRFHAYYRTVLPALARRVHAIATVSEYSRRSIVERLGIDPARVFLTPNGVDDLFRPPADDDRARILDRHGLGRRFFLTVGSLEPRKNLPRLLAAWDAASGNHAEVDLVIVGGLGDARVYGRRATVSTGPRVRLLGYVADSELPALYAAADAFCYVSLDEGFGLPPLEARACGARLLVSRAGAMPEVLGGHALFVEPTSIDDIAAGLDACLAQEGGGRLTGPALEAFRREHRWEASAARLREVLDGAGT